MISRFRSRILSGPRLGLSQRRSRPVIRRGGGNRRRLVGACSSLSTIHHGINQPMIHHGITQPPLGCRTWPVRSEEHTSELQSQSNLVCRLLLEKKKETLIRSTQYSKLSCACLCYV